MKVNINVTLLDDESFLFKARVYDDRGELLEKNIISKKELPEVLDEARTVLITSLSNQE